MVAACLLAVSACTQAAGSGAVDSTNGQVTAVGKKVAGGTVTWAEFADQIPVYIFPLAGPQYLNQPNIGNFQELMYRPLYWFGNDKNQPVVDSTKSLASAPVWSDDDKKVTITLKPYKWSNGETVSSRDVIFWMNLLKVEKDNWGSYVPGAFPDNVVSYAATSPTTVVFDLDKSYNENWFLYNELSQVTPLPMAWDRTSGSGAAPNPSASGLPDTTTSGAKAVYTYLDSLAKNSVSWAGSPIWSIVDGPFRLSDFTNTGQATFVPNPHYSGPVRPSIAKFVEVPITSQAAEVNLAKSGPQNLTVGYLPLDDYPIASQMQASGYRTIEASSFDSAYFPLNLNNPKFGPVFRQLYFRQAFQHLVDQNGWIKAYFHGIGSPTYGPVPAVPANSFVSKQNKSTNLYPFSVSTASHLLSSHGWKVNAGGVTTCVKPGSGPGECGAGVPAGLGLDFNLDYITGNTTLAESMQNLKSDAGEVGIKLELTQHPYSTVAGVALPCKPTESDCQWTAENWAVGWIYTPDYYPSGEALLQTGANYNFGSYTDPLADKLIKATTTASAADSQSALNAYQNYVAQQLPVVFEPTSSGNPIPDTLPLVSQHLGGYTTNAFGAITPEQWYLTK
jgi:peptide/nickel transport system substrate-binding protein